MDIFEQLELILKNGYSIEYYSVNQISNGNEEAVKNKMIPLITYTVCVVNVNTEETIYTESCNSIKECLLKGIEYYNNEIRGERK